MDNLIPYKCKEKLTKEFYMANKYYYNGKLVRTSDHIYTHAVLNEKGEVIACRPSFEKASNVITSEVSKAKKAINENNKGIEARKAGKDGFWTKDGNTKYFVSFS